MNKTIYLLIGVLLLSGCVNSGVDNSEFFKDYIIAVNDLHLSQQKYEFAYMDMQYGELYMIKVPDYNYESAETIFKDVKGYLNRAKELLLKSKDNLKRLKAPNVFYEKDIKLRLEQIDINILIVEADIERTNYNLKVLYETNYGSAEKALDFNNKANALVPIKTNYFKKQSEVGKQLDLLWDQEWYEKF